MKSGAAGDWSIPANWSTNPFYPDNGHGAEIYHAVIGGGQVNVDIDVTLEELSLLGGVLEGAGDLQVQLVHLDGGTLGTTGAFDAATFHLQYGVIARDLTLGSGNHDILNIAIAGGYTLTNSSGSTLSATTGQPGEGQSIGPGTFLNEGTFIKNGPLRYYLSIPTVNAGLMRVEQNNLRLMEPGTHSGLFEIQDGQLEFSADQHLLPGADVSGPGSLLLLGGTATIDSDISTGQLVLDHGTLAGTGNLHPARFNLHAGTVARDLTLPAGEHDMLNIAVAEGFTLTNPAGTTLRATTGEPGKGQSIGPGTFVNEGTFVKGGPLRYYLSIPTVNAGLMRVEQNNLRFTEPGSHSGLFEIQVGQLEFEADQYLLPGANVSGAGSLLLLAGTATIDSDVSTSQLVLGHGMLAGTGNLHPARFSLQAGTLARDLVLPAGEHDMLNIAIAGGFTLTNPAGSTLRSTTGQPGESQSIGPGTFVNEGTFAKSGPLRYYLSIPTVNAGLMRVEQNNLRLTQPGTHTGLFEIQDGQLEFSANQHLLPGADVFGPGSLLLLGGTATIDSDVSSGRLVLGNGSLAGTGNLHSERFSLDAGTLARNLTLTAGEHDLRSVQIEAGFQLINPPGTNLLAHGGTVGGLGAFVNEGMITKVDDAPQLLNTFVNAASGRVLVQQGKLAVGAAATQHGTFTIAAGATLELGGQATSDNLLDNDSLITGEGSLRVTQGFTAIVGDNDNDFAGGTTIAHGGRLTIIGAGTALGAGAVAIQTGVLSIGLQDNLHPQQAVVQDSGALAVSSDFIPLSRINAASTGTFAIDVLDFATPVDQSTLGAGAMSLGASTTGVYTATTMQPGSDGAYRLGGGGGTLTIANAGVLEGEHPLIIRGPGKVIIQGQPSYTQGTIVRSGMIAPESAAALGNGPILLQGGGLSAENNSLQLDQAVSIAGNVEFGGNFELTLNGPIQLVGNRTLTVSSAATTVLTGNIGEDAAGRSLTKQGAGTLILGAGNSFTGGLDIRAGMVIAAVDQTYQGTTAIQQGAALALAADMEGNGQLLVRGGGTLAGEGGIAGQVIDGNGALISPGESPGELEFRAGLTLQSGSRFEWELSELTTLHPGVDWDQLDISGGTLNILPGAILDLYFIDAATSPDATSFWRHSRQWHDIIDVSAAATNPSGFVSFSIDNSTWSQFGAFATIESHSGQGVNLVWTPVPEPSAACCALIACATLAMGRVLVGRRTFYGVQCEFTSFKVRSM